MAATEGIMIVLICLYREDSRRLYSHTPHFGPSYLLIYHMVLDLVIVHKTKFFPRVLVSERTMKRTTKRTTKRT